MNKAVVTVVLQTNQVLTPWIAWEKLEQVSIFSLVLSYPKAARAR